MLRMCLRSPKKSKVRLHRARKGETGFTSKEMLTKHLTNLQGPVYYIAGPPPWWRVGGKCLWTPVLTRTTSERQNLAAIEARPSVVAGRVLEQKKGVFRGEQHANRQAENENSS